MWAFLIPAVIGCALLAGAIVLGIRAYHKRHPIRYVDYDHYHGGLYGDGGVDEWEHTDR
jgi:hypothetical protein